MHAADGMRVNCRTTNVSVSVVHLKLLEQKDFEIAEIEVHSLGYLSFVNINDIVTLTVIKLFQPPSMVNHFSNYFKLQNVNNIITFLGFECTKIPLIYSIF